MSDKSSLEIISHQISTNAVFDRSMVEAILNAYDMLSPYSAGRTKSVTSWATCIGKTLKLDETTLKNLETSSMLCDIGMWAIPEYIVNKKGRLTLSEFKLIQQHPTLTLNTLKALPLTTDIQKNILYHHESYNGTGYPEGLAGENIPIPSQIINICCALFALTSLRPYRDPFEIDEAVEIIQKERDKQFNPVVVDALRIALDEGKIGKITDTQAYDPFASVRHQIDLNFKNW